MSTLSQATCPICRSKHWDIFFEMPKMPVYCNVLWADQYAARNCGRGDIQLAFCSDCGFIGNVAFDPVLLEYTQNYENALDFSPRFQDYARSLATRLVEKYDLRKKDIIEIGCGKGEFLISLCELGNNQGIGFDPTYVPLPEHDRVSGQVQFIRDLYSAEYAGYPSDFICCRHTLEHVQDPVSLLKTLRQAIGDRSHTAVFFEVPNALDTFRHLAIWDIIYEHCCYFAPVTLSYAFATSGFQVNAITEEYMGQFLCLEATPSKPASSMADKQMTDLESLKSDVESFTRRFQEKANIWQENLQKIASRRDRAVIWGGGSKGVTFLNLLNAQESIEYVVDINPRKQGKFVAGTGQQIVTPDFLRDYCPDLVIVMNAVYQDEIKQMIADLNLEAELMCVTLN